MNTAIERGAQFVTRNRIGYVVFDTARVPDGLREFAMRAFALKKIAEGEGYELYVPDLASRHVANTPTVGVP
jgi:hypothetical protein